jgi:hypothetical protein
MVDAIFFIFLQWSAMVWKHPTNPADTKEDTGMSGGVLARGQQSFLQGVMASFLIKDTFGHDDGNCASCGSFLVGCGVFFTAGTWQSMILAL